MYLLVYVLLGLTRVHYSSLSKEITSDKLSMMVFVAYISLLDRHSHIMDIFTLPCYPLLSIQLQSGHIGILVQMGYIVATVSIYIYGCQPTLHGLSTVIFKLLICYMWHWYIYILHIPFIVDTSIAWAFAHAWGDTADAGTSYTHSIFTLLVSLHLATTTTAGWGVLAMKT